MYRLPSESHRRVGPGGKTGVNWKQIYSKSFSFFLMISFFRSENFLSSIKISPRSDSLRLTPGPGSSSEPLQTDPTRLSRRVGRRVDVHLLEATHDLV